MTFSKDYNPDHFVDRPEVLNWIRKWADAAEIEKRVLSLVAPPGGGKTWILKKLHEEWGNPGSRFAVWMDVPTLVNRAEEQDRERMINPTAFQSWFEDVQKAVKHLCPHIKSISTLADYPAMVGKLVELLCDCNLEKAPLVIVDGYDEITKKQAEVFSLRILERLVERPCMRLLIAHRAEWTVRGDAIRRNQQRLFLQQIAPLSRRFALDQFKALPINKFSSTPILTPNSWMSQLQHYQWNNPLINSILFEHGLDKGSTQLRVLTSQDFYMCCQSVITRSDGKGNRHYHPLTVDEFKTFHRIATQLDQKWPQADIETLLNINFYRDVTISKLFDIGLVVNVSENPTFYQICEGLRELLCEIDISQVQFN